MNEWIWWYDIDMVFPGVNGKCKNLNIYMSSIHTDDAVRWHKCHSSRAHNGRYFHPNVLV